MKDMFMDFTEGLIEYYTETSATDNMHSITTRKLLLPHVLSFLDLIESTNDDEFIKVSN